MRSRCLWHMNLVAPWHVGSSWTRDQARVSQGSPQIEICHLTRMSAPRIPGNNSRHSINICGMNRWIFWPPYVLWRPYLQLHSASDLVSILTKGSFAHMLRVKVFRPDWDQETPSRLPRSPFPHEICSQGNSWVLGSPLVPALPSPFWWWLRW